MNEIKYCLIGIEDDLGVLNVGGRLGAALGPKSFYESLMKFKAKPELLQSLTHIEFIQSDQNLQKTLDSAAESIAKAHQYHPISLVIGGGHDQGYAQLKGLKSHYGSKVRMGCINIDAHLDLRPSEPKITSGSPFRMAIEENILNPKYLIEFGIQSHCNSEELFNYAKRQKIDVVKWSDIREGRVISSFKKKLIELSKKTDQICLQLDLDAIAEAAAPGVSAPQSEGLLPREVIAIMELAGAHPKVCSLGIFELNPLHDEGLKTSRLAATAAIHFMEAKSKFKSSRVNLTRLNSRKTPIQKRRSK